MNASFGKLLLCSVLTAEFCCSKQHFLIENCVTYIFVIKVARFVEKNTRQITELHFLRYIRDLQCTVSKLMKNFKYSFLFNILWECSQMSPSNDLHNRYIGTYFEKCCSSKIRKNSKLWVISVIVFGCLGRYYTLGEYLDFHIFLMHIGAFHKYHSLKKIRIT